MLFDLGLTSSGDIIHVLAVTWEVMRLGIDGGEAFTRRVLVEAEGDFIGGAGPGLENSRLSKLGSGFWVGLDVVEHEVAIHSANPDFIVEIKEGVDLNCF